MELHNNHFHPFIELKLEKKKKKFDGFYNPIPCNVKSDTCEGRGPILCEYNLII